MEFTIVKQMKDNPILRKSFIDLAIKTFDLSFEQWYEEGFWTEKYITYAFVHDNSVIANASVNIIDTLWKGQLKRYIQIGTVMTAEKYQKKGLSKRLLEEIISDWKDQCDCIYLFANSKVLDFYPKFGFVPAVEYQYVMPIRKSERRFSFIKLNMKEKESREILKSCYENSNPYSALPMNNNYELLMFYCGNFMKDCVYYSKELDMICIAEQEEDRLLCFDIFGKQSLSLEELISNVVQGGTKKALLGFTPLDNTKGEFIKIDYVENDATLFVLGEKENIFTNHKVMFPELSHA